MDTTTSQKWVGLILFVVLLAAIFPATVRSHCDTMNGPVVAAAQKALETKDVNLVLIWVQKNDEAEIKEAFRRTLVVRKLNPDAQKLADIYFFETLVRIHRAGEGVAYTGLKSAETEVEPGIVAADSAISSGSAKELVQHLSASIHQRIGTEYKHLMEKKRFQPQDVEAGREYVKAYVQFIHYVERLYQAATQAVEGHFHEGERTGMQREVHK